MLSPYGPFQLYFQQIALRPAVCRAAPCAAFARNSPTQPRKARASSKLATKSANNPEELHRPSLYQGEGRTSVPERSAKVVASGTSSPQTARDMKYGIFDWVDV